MRTTILAALSVTTLVLSACGGEEPPPQPPPPPPPPPATASATPPPADTTPPPPPKPALADLIPQAMKGMDDAFNAHDAQKMSSYVTDDVADYAYGSMPEETHSRGDMTTGMTQLFTAFPDAKGAVLRSWTKGNVAIQELAWTGTFKADMGPMKATNKTAGGMLVQIFWFNDDGLVKEIHEYGDGASMMAQLTGKKGAPPVPTLPTNPPETHVGKGTPDEDNLAAWAKGIDDTMNKGDVKAGVAAWAPDGDIWLNLGGPATKGTKDLTKMMQGWYKSLPDQKWAPTNAWGIDGFAIIEHTVSGTNKGPMGKLPASGKPVTWHFLDIYQPTADNKVQHDWAYANMLEFLKQTGQLKMPGDAGAKKGK